MLLDEQKTTVKGIYRLSKNGFIVYLSNGKRYLISYDTIIAEIDYFGQVRLDKEYWAFSNTTSKDRCKFLKEQKAETDKKIKSGEYILTNLN